MHEDGFSMLKELFCLKFFQNIFLGICFLFLKEKKQYPLICKEDVKLIQLKWVQGTPYLRVLNCIKSYIPGYNNLEIIFFDVSFINHNHCLFFCILKLFIVYIFHKVERVVCLYFIFTCNFIFIFVNSINSCEGGHYKACACDTGYSVNKYFFFICW